MRSRREVVLDQPGNAEIALLVAILEDGYGHKAWHGPNLRGSIRRLSPEQASWRPNPKRRSIAEIVVHATYWKYAVRRRLRDDKRGSFPIHGSNWFAVPSPLTTRNWRQFITLLEDEHRALRQAVAGFPPERLHQLPKGGKITYATLIYGVAAHDVYHAGQIQLLKRLQA
jgi:uncharacterized damage-inducible protein DinB